MRGQLERFARLSGQDGLLTVQVLPFASGAHPGADSSPVAIFRFAPVPGLSAVHLDNLAGGSYLDDFGGFAAHTVAFAGLRDTSYSPGESVRLLAR